MGVTPLWVGGRGGSLCGWMHKKVLLIDEDESIRHKFCSDWLRLYSQAAWIPSQGERTDHQGARIAPPGARIAPHGAQIVPKKCYQPWLAVIPHPGEQSVRPEGQSVRPEGQSVRPGEQSMRPERQSVRPEP